MVVPVAVMPWACRACADSAFLAGCFRPPVLGVDVENLCAPVAVWQRWQHVGNRFGNGVEQGKRLFVANVAKGLEEKGKINGVCCI